MGLAALIGRCSRAVARAPCARSIGVMDLARSTAIAFVYRALGMFLLALLGVITARALSVEGRGDYASTMVYLAAGGNLVASFSSATGYFVAGRGRPAAEIAANALVLAGVVGLVGLMIGVTSALFLEGELRIVLLLVGLALFPPTARHALGGVFIGSEMHFRYALALYSPAYFSIVLFLVVLVGMNHRSAEVAVGLAIGADYLSFLVLFVLCRRWWTWLRDHRPDPRLMRNFVSYGAVTGLAGFVSFFNYRIDLILVRAIDGSAGAGLYANAVALAEALWLFSTVVTIASFASIGRLERAEAAALTARSVRHTLIMVAGGGLVLFVLAPQALLVIFGERYQEAATALRILCIGTALWAPASVLSTYFSVQLGRPVIPLSLALLSCVLNIVVSSVLIPRIGYEGGAWGTALSYGPTIVIATVLFRRMAPIRTSDLWRIRRGDLVDYARLVHRVIRRGLDGRQRIRPGAGGPS